MSNVRVELDVPEELFFTINVPKENMGDSIKKLFLLELYREKQLSLGKLCSLSGISKWEFFELNKKYNIPINISDEEWENDKEIIEEFF